MLMSVNNEFLVSSHNLESGSWASSVKRESVGKPVSQVYKCAFEPRARIPVWYIKTRYWPLEESENKNLHSCTLTSL